jgi:hypothetical protein
MFNDQRYDQEFKDLFNLKDPEELKYFNQIPKCNHLNLLAYIKDWVNIIQMHEFSISDFCKFKIDIIECHLEDFVVWDATNRNLFDLNWSLITNSKHVYLVFMMLENASIDIPKPEDLSLDGNSFSIIDDEIQKTIFD